MNEYPQGSLDRNVPFLVVSGLRSTSSKPLLTDPDLREQGLLIRSEVPPVEGREAKAVLQCIEDADITNRSWDAVNSPRRHRFKVRTIGRFLLPPRRARLPDDVEAPLSPMTLHSPFSPLSPGSTLYPDGLIDTNWLAKHQEIVPSVCLCFYSLTSDRTLSTLHDNQLKTDINAVKNAIAQSGYRIRLAVVILSDKSPATVGQFQDRLENIRKSTGLDPKTSLFVLPTQRAEEELEGAVDSVLTAVYEQALEYYRDLGRHARKKKGRGIVPQPTVPPTSGTSHTLTLQGWNVRYDFKAAVFAEFRNELDFALRSYDQAYDTLLGVDVLETIPPWNPRFNPARLLADIIAIRTVRSLLLLGQSTAAVRRWQAHHDRVADFIDRRGCGTQNYGWKCWEARWCTVMANLIEKIRFPELDPSTRAIFRPPEKNLSAERLQPWEMLHHAGYWHRAAAGHTLDRRKFAHAISEEDRKAPDTSAPSTSSGKTYKYDTYMCPEPFKEYPLEGTGVNHARLIFDSLTLATTEFQKRHQLRTSAELILESSKELERMKEWKQIVDLLAPVWRNMSFRTEGWWDIMTLVSWTSRAAAVKDGQKALTVAIDWELLNKGFSKRPGWHYDITRSLEEIDSEERPTINLDDEHLKSFLSASFAFKHEEGRSGRICPAQLALVSNTFTDAAPVVIDKVQIMFDGSLRTVRLQHDADAEQTVEQPYSRYSHVTLMEDISNDGATDDDSESDSREETATQLRGKANLLLRPGETRILEMDIPLREAGDARAVSVQVAVQPKAFKLLYLMRLQDSEAACYWYPPNSRRRPTRKNAQRIRVLPRPPRMEIKMGKMLEQYYANEPLRLEVEILNEEEADADTKLDVILHGQGAPSFNVQVIDGEERSSKSVGDGSRPNGVPIGAIKASETSKTIITLDPVDRPAVYDLTIKASYHLVTDPATPIVLETAYQLNIVSPFEANYDLLPRLHSEWPSIFDFDNIDPTDHEEALAHPRGLAQRWCLATRYASFALEDVLILDLDVKVLGAHGNVSCTASKCEPMAAEGVTISPKTIEEAHFDLIAQKLSLDDRTPSTADLAFVIKWRRLSSPASLVNTTTLPLPRFYVTVQEPRVLAAVSYSAPPTEAASSPTAQSGGKLMPPQLVFLDVTIENPSSHFLTFGLVMEPSDEFAFAGAKTTTLNVLPVARRTVSYRLLPLVRGAWIRPTLVVRDKYFQKVLKIVPTEGMKSDKDGVLLWVPPEEEEEGEGGGGGGGEAIVTGQSSEEVIEEPSA
ncbi:Gryzun, putative trafficking through golgi-domain-containing protein [Xylariomycetidae sp. FL0641]|nr:Gryzun, putative trafficking through golgi-domain-containing protein [Xylariomycetidae sp. FL0641]